MAALNQPETLLRRLFERAVATADPMRVVAEHLPPWPKGKLLVIGAGKASARMAEAVEAHYGRCDGLVITRYGYGRPCEGITIVEAAHPVPDAAGLAATAQMLDMLTGLGPDDLVLALISGGGSALLCAPAFGLSLAEKQAVNAALLASGAPIAQMNLLRKHLSLVKGGQLARAAFPARVLALMISDVPGDDPSLIASGPTVGDASTAQDALDVVQRWAVPLPGHALAALSQGSNVVPADDPVLATVDNLVIAAPSQSLRAAAELGAAEGCQVLILGDALEGEAREVGQAQAKKALALSAAMEPGAKPILILSGGELTVTRTGQGIGGPNAEFCLAAAIALNEAAGIYAIACDTDGADGADEVAGAVIGPNTLRRARSAGCDPLAALAAHDSHSFFGQIGAQVVTGPTLTNVNDFRAILILPQPARAAALPNR
jgi:glycerate 2-kinase